MQSRPPSESRCVRVRSGACDGGQALHRGNAGRLRAEARVDKLMEDEMALAATRIQSIARASQVRDCVAWAVRSAVTL